MNVLVHDTPVLIGIFETLWQFNSPPYKKHTIQHILVWAAHNELIEIPDSLWGQPKYKWASKREKNGLILSNSFNYIKLAQKIPHGWEFDSIFHRFHDLGMFNEILCSV